MPPFVCLENLRGTATVSTETESFVAYLELFRGLEERAIKGEQISRIKPPGPCCA